MKEAEVYCSSSTTSKSMQVITKKQEIVWDKKF